jgi:hypothetical protein
MCACPLGLVVAVANPYVSAQIFALVALLVAFALWAVVKPPAVMVLRVPTVIAAITTMFAVLAAEVGVFYSPEPACKLALQSSLLLTSCLVAELVGGWRRDRIPRAIARWFRG